MKCRFCQNKLKIIFTDLGMSPLANSYVNSIESEVGEVFFPLKTFVCEKCFLVQLGEFKSPNEIFKDYAYFSSFSSSWVNQNHRVNAEPHGRAIAFSTIGHDSRFVFTPNGASI